MRADLKMWLETGTVPADFYDLLGVPRFARDREALLAAGRAGYAALQGYQNADEALRRQAHKLQMQFAAAVQTFSTDDAWRDYDHQLRHGTHDRQRALGASGGRSQTRLSREAHAVPEAHSTASIAAPFEANASAPEAAAPSPAIVAAVVHRSAEDEFFRPALAADGPVDAFVAAGNRSPATVLWDALSQLDPRGVRVMLIVAAVTANALFVFGACVILVLRLLGRQGG